MKEWTREARYRALKDPEEIRANWACQREFRPVMEEETRARLQKGWKRAVRCAVAWAAEESGDESMGQE